ncbi:hypothetical protein HHL21_17180 [Massilia sp. RP-1-19]|uniref:Uncharacterized protein n=1 Tax=Massilia polaris TaxID=2728846 RepID=A0A848HRM2_9BURK|nr:hypothetical protein [Massilia polaris]NML62780.1 hypothetical protein [Massilia polaris]
MLDEDSRVAAGHGREAVDGLEIEVQVHVVMLHDRQLLPARVDGTAGVYRERPRQQAGEHPRKLLNRAQLRAVERVDHCPDAFSLRIDEFSRPSFEGTRHRMCNEEDKGNKNAANQCQGKGGQLGTDHEIAAGRDRSFH